MTASIRGHFISLVDGDAVLLKDVMGFYNTPVFSRTGELAGPGSISS
jgi:hypothetical protein